MEMAMPAIIVPVSVGQLPDTATPHLPAIGFPPVEVSGGRFTQEMSALTSGRTLGASAPQLVPGFPRGFLEGEVISLPGLPTAGRSISSIPRGACIARGFLYFLTYLSCFFVSI
jgi:hypothetical protein